jgi:hypothetical protein
MPFYIKQELKNDTGLFRNSFVAEAVRRTAYRNSKSAGAKYPQVIKHIPTSLIAYALTLVNFVL